jgi:hypothetical protein
MRNSYISNSAEALNLHNGTQTAIVVAMKVQPYIDDKNNVKLGKVNYGKHLNDTPNWENFVKCESPYALGQEVYVRETWCPCDTEDGNIGYAYKDDEYAEKFVGWESPANMPKLAARTRFYIVSCEAVRVKDITEKQANQLACERLHEDDLGQTFKSHKRGFERDAITRFGQSAWDNNDYIWYYKIEKI